MVNNLCSPQYADNMVGPNFDNARTTQRGPKNGGPRPRGEEGRRRTAARGKRKTATETLSSRSSVWIADLAESAAANVLKFAIAPRQQTPRTISSPKRRK